MLLSPAFYEQTAQIIPVLLLTGMVEMAATSRRWVDRTLPLPFVILILVWLVVVVAGETAALWSLANDRDSTMSVHITLYGLGAAGTLALTPLVDTVLEWTGDENAALWRWIGSVVALLPFLVAVVATVVVAG